MLVGGDRRREREKGEGGKTLTDSTASPKMFGKLKKNFERSNTPKVDFNRSALVRASRIGWKTVSALLDASTHTQQQQQTP